MTVSATRTDQTSPSGNPRVLAHVFAQTDVGRTREHNEDTFLVADLESGDPVLFDDTARDIAADDHGLLFLVADGMGGAASGELASSMAGFEVLSVLRERWRSQQPPSADGFAEALRDATIFANSQIHGYARENPEHRGMGTTATIAGLLGDVIYVAQVGDSRAYLLRDGVARQLTKDQSLMQRLVEAGELTPEQAEASERRNIILQALGPEAHVTIDLTHQQLRRGDILLLCSDGLSGLVRADEIARIASEVDSPRALCQRLIDRANELGGPDNITVVAAQFDGDALHSVNDRDAVGYNTYPLAGTLNHDTAEEPVPERSMKTQWKSDPTPRYGTPAPSRAAIDEEFARARAAEDDAILGAPEEVVRERRQRVEPVYYALGAVAVIAMLWVLITYLRDR
ncbi:MAG: serine/threonine-protein phosphatase [Gemmatimonadaceae bacterium]|nr:serine/threonine-protein phosphatase [Gemmatimonadaceae bacterium]